jgi:hypothetical protein
LKSDWKNDEPLPVVPQDCIPNSLLLPTSCHPRN